MFEKLDADTINCIKSMRKDGYSRDEIAYELGISAGVVSKYCRGIPRGKHKSQPQPSQRSSNQDCRLTEDCDSVEPQKALTRTQADAEEYNNNWIKTFELTKQAEFQNYLYQKALKKQNLQPKVQPKPKKLSSANSMISAERQKLLTEWKEKIYREIVGDGTKF